MHSEWISLEAANGFHCPAWQAMPTGTPHAAVVVLQEIFGVNPHIRAVTERFAARGYLAIAPALFARVQANVELGYSPADLQAGIALKTAAEQLPGTGILADIQAAIDHAAAQSGRKVGIVGFCWGGLMTWRAACELQGLSAAVSYYGGGITTAAEMARQPRCPVLAHFAHQDQWIPMDGVQAFAAAHPEVQSHVYDADHGFNCDQRNAYDEAAAVAARNRTLAFFGQHLA